MRTSLLLAAALTLVPAVAGQTLTRTNGVLGGSADYALQGTPGELYLLLPSLQPGPTPVGLLNPGDPRLLSVGLDQSALWSVGLLDGVGQASKSYSLPPDPGLHGVPVFAQFVTLTLGPLTIDDISNPTAVTLAESGRSHGTIGNMLRDSAGHSSTLLDDGSVLIGGGTQAGVSSNGLERFDPQTQSFVATGVTLTIARTAHTATKLADGRVLFLGGVGAAGGVLVSAEIYDPLANTVITAAPMSSPRTQHTATLLADGRVLVVAGTSNFDFTDPLAALGSVLRSSALFDPIAGTWAAGPDLPRPRLLHAATLLGNDKVLVTGGVDVTTIFIPIPGFTSDCRLYDPGSNSFQSAGSFNTPRAAHAQLRLSNGNVLLVGGTDGNLLAQTFSPLASCRLYTTAGNSWSDVASLANPRALPSGLFQVGSSAYVLGGFSTFDLTSQSGVPVLDVEQTGLPIAWSVAGQIVSARAAGISTAIEGGQRILSTGAATAGDTSAEIFVP